MSSKEQYEVIEVLGTGTFGTVSRIRLKGTIQSLTSSKNDLVWKEINFGRMCDKEKAQIVSEVNILRDLRCPFIVKYHDRIIDKLTKKLYIVMEYCPGGDLSQVIKKCKKDRVNLDENLIWKVFSQAIIALKCCHRRKENNECKPVIHRDLKPANILLDSYQNIKIADFGLAKELNGISILASTNVGTPYYMAPEIINEKGYDERCDIWSLGCLIYELAALRPPFEATNAVSLAMKVNTGKFPRIPSKYSDALFDSIKMMLQLDPKARPRIEELESLPGLTIAMNNSKALLTEFNNNANNSKLKMKEDALKAKEDALKTKEDSLKNREDTIKAKEDNLKAKEDAFNTKEASLLEREKELNRKEVILKDQILIMKKQKEEIENHAKINTMTENTTKQYEFQSKAIGFNIPIDNPSIPSSYNNIFQKVTYSHGNTPLPTTNNNVVRSTEIDSALKRAKEVLSSCNARDVTIKRSVDIDIPIPPLNRKIKTGSEDSKENVNIDYHQFKNRAARPPIVNEMVTKRMKISNSLNQ
jgi:NIMA (never in mitosis gene a)-related kinase